ncbi:MAG TPA: hypothetical protein VF644_01695 [Pyrinomonadaceae bacterium]
MLFICFAAKIRLSKFSGIFRENAKSECGNFWVINESETNQTKHSTAITVRRDLVNVS